MKINVELSPIAESGTVVRTIEFNHRAVDLHDDGVVYNSSAPKMKSYVASVDTRVGKRFFALFSTDDGETFHFKDTSGPGAFALRQAIKAVQQRQTSRLSFPAMTR